MKPVVTIAAALFSGILCAGTSQADLSAGMMLQFVGKNRGVKPVPMVQTAAAKTKLPEAVWNVQDSPYAILQLNKELVLRNFSSVTVKVKLQTLPGCPITVLNLRARDKNGEIFQYRQRVDFKKGGVFEVEVPLDKSHQNACWGGRQPANKIVDQPLTLSNLTFDYPSKGAQEIKVTILSITAETVESSPAIQSGGNVLQADLSAGMMLQFVGKNRGVKPVPMVQTAAAKTKLPEAVWNVQDSPYAILQLNKKPVFRKYSSVTVKVKLQTLPGCPIVALALRAYDKNGEIFQYRKRVDFKKGGVFEVEVPLNKAHQNACWGGRQPANQLVDQPLTLSDIVFDYPSKVAKEIKLAILSITAELVSAPNAAVLRPVYQIGDNTSFFR